MPRAPDDHKKRLLSASPEKQKGVSSHDKKRRHIETNHILSDMEESENEAMSSPSLHIAPPSPDMTNLSISAETPRDTDGDTTMVGQTPPGTPSEAGNEVQYPDLEPMTPPPGTKRDPVWIVKRTKKTPDAPPFTQSTQNKGNADHARLPPQLPKSLIRTPTPVGGFPIIHLSTPPWFNLLPDQRAFFDTYPEPKLWIRDWRASKDTDLMATSDRLKELILRMTGEQAKLSTPQPEKEIIIKYRKDKQTPPYYFLISGISMKANDILLAHPIISTPEASAFILPYSPPLPLLLCTLEGFTLSIRNKEAITEAEETATAIIRKALSEDEALITLLKSRLIGDTTSQHNLDPAINIILGLEVKLVRGEESIDRTALFKPRKPLWNVFFQYTPPITWTSYFTILQHIRDNKFIDMDYRSATLVDEENRLHCNNCKGADHNAGQCEYNTLKGWHGSKSTEKIEETAEFASSSKYDRTRPGGGSRSERRAENWRGSRGLPYGQRRERR